MSTTNQQQTELTNADRLRQFNEQLFPWVKRMTLGMFAIGALVLVAVLLLYLFALWWVPDMPSPRQRIALFHFSEKALLHTVQITFGLLLGFTWLALGLVLCWFGITGALALTVQGSGGAGPDDKGSFKLQSEHVGVVLLLGGVILLYAAISKQVTTTSIDRVLLEEPSVVTPTPPGDGKSAKNKEGK